MRKKLLERVIEDSFEEYQKPLVVKYSEIWVPVHQARQENLFKRGVLKKAGVKEFEMIVRNHIGYFYEHLTAAIFGGDPTLKDRFEILNLEAEPDIVQMGLEREDTKPLLIESKGMAIQGGDCKLYDHQTLKYFLMQMGESEMYYDPEIFYAIYGHSVRGITKVTEGRKKEVIKQLSENTEFLAFLHFSIIFRIFEQKLNSRTNRSEYVRNGIAVPMSRFRPREVYELMLHPKHVIESIGLNPEDYLIERRKLPEDVSFNQNKVKCFPSLYIEPKNHEEWLEEFKNNNGARLREIIEKVENLQGGKAIQQALPLILDDEIPF